MFYDDVYYKKTPCEICKNDQCGLTGKRNTHFDKKNKCNSFVSEEKKEFSKYFPKDWDLGKPWGVSPYSGGSIWTK